MHEIVTLQFGTQSNYLGTHFWNTQVGSRSHASSIQQTYIQSICTHLALSLVCYDARLWRRRVLVSIRHSLIRGRLISVLILTIDSAH